MRLISRLLFFCVVLALISFRVGVRAESDKIPLPVALVLNEANELLLNDQVSEAIILLEAFKTKGVYSGKSTAKRANRKDGQHYLVSLLLGNCYLTTDQPAEAITEYQWVVQKEPTHFQAWSNLAKAHYDSGNLDEAANAFTRVYLLDETKNPQYLYYAAISLLSNDHPDDSVRVFERILIYHPDAMKLSWKKLLVSVYFNLEVPRKAFPLIKEIIDAESVEEKRRWQEILLSQYTRLGLEKEAMTYAEHLVAIDPVYGKWWKTLASLKLEKELYSETLTALIIYSKLDSLTVEEQKLMASLCLALEIPVESSKIYELMAEGVINKEVINGLVQSYARLYEPEMVIKWISVGLENFEDDSLRLMRANLLFNLKRYDQAISDYKILTERKEKDGEAWLMMGYAYLNLNDTNKASEAFKTAKTFPDQKKAAMDVLKHLQARTARTN